jgi:hypothetical protein
MTAVGIRGDSIDHAEERGEDDRGRTANSKMQDVNTNRQ